jgi:ubiquinone/menaquinone biosynthesis C-methylase UbiE
MNKTSVREYFDQEAESYADAYGPASASATDDTRTRTFLERRELSLKALRTPIARVLDIGAGPGVFTTSLTERGTTCWVVDLSVEMVEAARRRVPAALANRARFAAADIEHLPFADGAFDTVVCVGVLQYVEDVQQAFAEMARVTAPGGQLIVTFPNSRSPLNRLHAGVIAAARIGLASLRAVGVPVRPSPSRLTFRGDVLNRSFDARQIEQCAASAGLAPELMVYHLLLFPFRVPGLGPLLNAWNRRVAGKQPRGRLAVWGREGIMRLGRG